jgi:hypothetical protein
MMISRIEPRPSLEEAAAIELALQGLSFKKERAVSKWVAAGRVGLQDGCYSPAACKKRSSWIWVARREAIAQVV